MSLFLSGAYMRNRFAKNLYPRDYRMFIARQIDGLAEQREALIAF